MIQRSVVEWGCIPYGDGETEIPQWAADRLAAVARTSELSEGDGGNILTLGRHQLRAAQVVGIIAAPGCTLEILPKIDTRDSDSDGEQNRQTRSQLVHMLAVALDIEIDAGEIADIGTQDDHLLEVLIRVFVRRLAECIRKGMPRQYVSRVDDLPMLRGRLDVSRQFRVHAINPSRLACQFDELTIDTPLNQVMKATIARLRKVSCTAENQRRLRELSFAYLEVSEIPERSLNWNSVVLDRTNESWRCLLDMAHLFLRSQFQTTSFGGGRGFSLLFEMNTLFEEYTARMLMRSLRDTGLRVVSQGGRQYCLTEFESGKKRFQTRPDILVMRGDKIELIVDTKWKRLKNQWDSTTRGVSQSDIYQMMVSVVLWPLLSG